MKAMKKVFLTRKSRHYAGKFTGRYQLRFITDGNAVASYDTEAKAMDMWRRSQRYCATMGSLEVYDTEADRVLMSRHVA